MENKKEGLQEIMSGIEVGIIHFLDGKFLGTFPKGRSYLDLGEIAKATMCPIELIEKNMAKLEKRGYLDSDSEGHYFIQWMQ